jgi:uncharacterized membrane protein
MLNALTIMQMQIITTLRFHLIPVGLAIIKKKTATNTGKNREGEGVVEMETEFYTLLVEM